MSRPPRRLRRFLALGATLMLCEALAVPRGAASAQAVEGFSYGNSPLAAARLGVAIATVAELADSPALLARPSSQTFVDETFAEVPVLTGEQALASRVRAARLLLEPGATGGRSTIDAALGGLERDLPPALGAPRDRLFVLGALAEQSAYDARVLRDPAVDRNARAALATLDVADPFVRGLDALRGDLARQRAQNWEAIAADASRIVAEILGRADAVPFPTEPGVWIVLLRTRATGADAARGGAPHFSLDVVGFDGSHRSLAAYPGAPGDFGHNAATMPCLANREPEIVTTTSHVAPVDPPVGTTVAQLARALEVGCAADARGLVPYVAKDASDDRFLTGLLVASGVDAAPLLRSVR